MSAVAEPTRPMRRRTDREGLLAWALLLPSLLYLFMLVAVPLGVTIALAFSGRRRGIAVVPGDGVFWRAFGDSLLVTAVATALVMILGMVLAHLLLAEFRGRWMVRVLALSPWTTPVALSAVAWRGLLGSAYSPLFWLPDAGTWAGWLTPLVVVHVWRLTPLAAVILMAGMAALPRELGDAARVDGAGFWRRTFGVTVPLTLPVTALTALALAFVTLGDLAVAHVLTGDRVEVLPSLAYLRAVRDGAPGRSAAMALFLIPMMAAGVFAAVRVLRGGGAG